MALNTHQAEAIATADAHLNNVILPTYSEAIAMLNELAVYVKNGVASDALLASADRALKAVEKAV